MAEYTVDGLINIKDAEGNKYSMHPFTRDENVSLSPAVATALGLTGNPQVKDALDKLATLVSTAQTTANGRSRLAIVSYSTTDTFGASNPTIITAPFPPKAALLFNSEGNDSARIVGFAFIDDANAVYGAGIYGSSTAYKPTSITRSGNTIKMYDEGSAAFQFNNQVYGVPKTYTWVVLG